MARITDPRLSTTFGPIQTLIRDLVDYLRQIQKQLNSLSEGSITASYAANTAPPTTGNNKVYAQGDFIKNSKPAVLGSTGSQYVVTGWICTVGGTPGTWVACRSLTGT